MIHNTKKILKIAGILVFFFLITTYAFFTSKDLIFGVKIKNIKINDVSIVNGAKTDNLLKVTGNAKNATTLTLNGREISIDQSGNFSETIALLRGYNVIDLRAEDKFEDSDEEIYKLIY